MPEKDRTFHVVLSTEDDVKLRELAHLHRTSQGAVIRQLISARFSMDIEQKPTCANMLQCLVPHMHGSPASPAAP